MGEPSDNSTVDSFIRDDTLFYIISYTSVRIDPRVYLVIQAKNIIASFFIFNYIHAIFGENQFFSFRTSYSRKI